ncbi:ATP-binding protein [Thiovibrio frasassiensis]|uniref:histidine kinase n=1 Tax=Thiovibrio frasassiensis TaxID=2984131 RepID=A0A9X4MIA2_9BACT|nr:ATP-binding protein [Thiovibrio frasassiensis]MDG4476730.1 ATP-binding protein [Thiovibrio frasassiensis]
MDKPKPGNREPNPDRVVPRFLLIAFSCLLLISVVAGVIFYYYQKQMMNHTIREQGRGILSSYVSQTRDSIEKGQRKTFQLVMDNIAQLEGVTATTLYPREGLMNYRSGTVTVGLPFVHSQPAGFVSTNLVLYEKTRGMFLRKDWHLAGRFDSAAGQIHLAKVQDKDCAECHYVLDKNLRFNKQNRAEMLDAREAHFYERIPVEDKCTVCHTYWQTGETAGVLGVTIDKAAFLQQTADSTRQLIYILLANATVVLLVTYLIATMYRRILITRRQLADKSDRLAGLLNNSGQGFLSFGPDLAVEPEYSRECLTFFGKEVAGASVAALLFPEDKEERDRFGANIERIVQTADEFQRDILLSLMPKELFLNDRYLDIAYRLLGAERLMLIITDITEQRRLEARVAEEQTHLRFIVAAVTESAELFEVLDDYRNFAENTLPRLLAAPDEELAAGLAEIYRQVHTFKGLFGQLEFFHLPRCLHQYESALNRLRRDLAKQQPDRGVLEKEQALADQALAQELAVLRETLGDSFFARRGHLSLTPEQTEMLERLADRLLQGGPGLDSEETREMLRRIKRLRYVSLSELLSGHAKAAVRLAERLEKELAPVEVEDHGVRVAPEIYGPFTKSLIHLFRNAVDHGLESPEERLEQGKEEEGHLRCRTFLEDEQIVVEIDDDGRGLDLEALRRKGVATGLFTPEQGAALDEATLRLLIFKDEFSTKEEVSELSGRGVGLAAVRMETERLGGRIEVDSTLGQGTRFRFILPYLEALKDSQTGKKATGS